MYIIRMPLANHVSHFALAVRKIFVLLYSTMSGLCNKCEKVISPGRTDTRFYYPSGSIVASSQANCTKFEHVADVGATQQTSNYF